MHPTRGDKFDIGLVVSAFVGLGHETPRILIADPEYHGRMFWKHGELYYRYRHFSRVMQYIGATPLARELYIESNNILYGRQPKRFYFEDLDQYDIGDMKKIEVDNSFYVGHWFDKWIPEESFRYRRLKSIELPAPLKSRPKIKISVFQGLLDLNYQSIMQGSLADISVLAGEKLTLINETSNGEVASIFPDGTILIIKAFS